MGGRLMIMSVSARSQVRPQIATARPTATVDAEGQPQANPVAFFLNWGRHGLSAATPWAGTRKWRNGTKIQKGGAVVVSPGDEAAANVVCGVEIRSERRQHHRDPMTSAPAEQQVIGSSALGHYS